jgi:hypothetical protein
VAPVGTRINPSTTENESINTMSNNLCFQPEPDTEYEKLIDRLYELTGLCYCNLCQALGINGWKNRENDDDESVVPTDN